MKLSTLLFTFLIIPFLHIDSFGATAEEDIPADLLGSLSMEGGLEAQMALMESFAGSQGEGAPPPANDGASESKESQPPGDAPPPPPEGRCGRQGC